MSLADRSSALHIAGTTFTFPTQLPFRTLEVSAGDLDPACAIMMTDRDKATYLADMLKEYLEKKSKENASEDIISATTITLNKV